MDVLKPPILTIGNRCYRINTCSSSSVNTDWDAGYSGVGADELYDDETCDLSITETPSGFQCLVNYPSVYFKFILGKKGETKKRLETETRTQIKIPSAGHEGHIVISGSDRKGVISASNRIGILVDSARHKLPFTHFLSLPINNPRVKDNFLQFKEQICQRYRQERGVDDTIFQRVDKLHLTLGTLVLHSEEELNRAHCALLECRSQIIQTILQGHPLTVQVQGLEYMNDDPEAVDVLYAQVHLRDRSDRLQQLADQVVDYFVSEGLMYKEYDRVKLHITVMNTVMRRDPSDSVSQPQGDRHTPSPRESFDARKILQAYDSYCFGEQTFNCLHLSTRYSTGQDGYYLPASTLQF